MKRKLEPINKYRSTAKKLVPVSYVTNFTNKIQSTTIINS